MLAHITGVRDDSGVYSVDGESTRRKARLVELDSYYAIEFVRIRKILKRAQQQYARIGHSRSN